MAELVNATTGERLIRSIVRRGANAVYVGLGVFGANRPVGFIPKTGKPVPSNPYKNLRLTACFYADEEGGR